MPRGARRARPRWASRTLGAQWAHDWHKPEAGDHVVMAQATDVLGRRQPAGSRCSTATATSSMPSCATRSPWSTGPVAPAASPPVSGRNSHPPRRNSTDDRHRRTAGQQPSATPPTSTRATCRCRRPSTSPWSPAWTPASTSYGLLGLNEGDAHVIRNAGGVVTDDEIRSLAISQRLLGTSEIILIHHTDCGMLTFTDDEFKRASRRDRHQAGRGRPSRSPTSTRTSASRSRGSRPTRSSRTRTRSAASSTTSTTGAPARGALTEVR